MSVVRFIGATLKLYRVVPVNEAHVRILLDKKDVFSSRPSKDGKVQSSYWYVPFVTKIARLPLTNIRIDVNDVKLHDSNMAAFLADVVCFVNISDPVLAAERTEITMAEKRYEAIDDIAQDFSAILESIMRTVATKQTVLDIYQDRSTLDKAIETDIRGVFPQWGLSLVDLEIKDLKDVRDSTIILDIERKIAAQINADARVKVAQETNRAVVTESEMTKNSEMAKALNEEQWKKRQIEKEQVIALADQERLRLTAEKAKEANAKTVESERALKVGRADIDREAVIKTAEGTKSKTVLEAEGNAVNTKISGEAEAAANKAKLLASAEGTEKLALAQQKFNDAATAIEVIRANRDVGLAYANAYASVFKDANVNIVAGSAQEIFSGGILGSASIGPKEGAALQQAISADTSGSLKKLLDAFASGKKGGGEGK